MNITSILYAVGLLGGIGILAGLVLTFADSKFHVEVDEHEARVREAVSGANCGVCGYPGCDAFAAAVVRGEAPVNGCLPGGAKAAEALAEIMGLNAEAQERMVARVLCQGQNDVVKVRYAYTGYQSCRLAAQMSGSPNMCHVSCLGLGDCVRMCKFDALRIENGLATIDEEKCTACGLCVGVCPHNVIKVMPQSASVLVKCRNTQPGRAAREACQAACIGCKRCEKACQHDAIHVVDNCATIDMDKCTRCGDCVAVCPTKCITIV